MTKIGVGVGEDFPIEDRPPSGGGGDKPEDQSGRTDNQAGGESAGHGHRCNDAHAQAHDCDFGPETYEEWRAWREEWRSRRHEWRARRREWRRRYRAEMRERYGPEHPYHYYWGLPKILRIVIVVAAIMLIFRLIASAPFVILGLGLLAVLYVVHRNHEDARYRHDMPAPPPAGKQ